MRLQCKCCCAAVVAAVRGIDVTEDSDHSERMADIQVPENEQEMYLQWIANVAPDLPLPGVVC